jgi:hypothetical protein
LTRIVAAAGVVSIVLFAGTTISVHRSVARAAVPAQLRPLPLVFEPNVGQTGSHVRFLARAGRSTVFATRSRVMLALRRGAQDEVVAVRFPGADPAGVSAERRLPGVSNYHVGSDPGRWRTHVPQFGAARYSRLYPGIDLVLHGAHDARLEYDFRVAPGADPVCCIGSCAVSFVCSPAAAVSASSRSWFCATRWRSCGAAGGAAVHGR